MRRELFGVVLAASLLISAPSWADPRGCGGFINTHLRYPVNRAAASDRPAQLPKGPPLGTVTYVARGETATRTIESYMDTFCVTGLLVLHRGRIVLEQYRQGARPDDHLLSASMSKSILALLVGVAVSEGRLRLDEKVVDMLPGFEASVFGQATVEDLLRMTSGVALKTSYEKGGISDNQATNPIISPDQDVGRYLRDRKEADPAGKVFHYNGAVTAMLGAVLRARTGQTNTDYLSEKLWRPLGAQAPAYWITNKRGEEGVQGQFLATLRDYARLGLLVMNNGKVGDTRVVPEKWISQMVALRMDKPQPGGPQKYGLHIWIPQAARGRSMFLGTNGQAIFIDPVAQVVIVHTANAPEADYNGNGHLYPLRDAIIRELTTRLNFGS